MRVPLPSANSAALCAIVASAVLAGCGTAELDIDPVFDGTWVVDVLVVDGSTLVDPDGVDGDAVADITIEIDTGEAAVRGRTGCGPLLGSYSLDGGDTGEGPASFTIPSPSPGDDCPAADRSAHEGLVTGLEQVTRWRRDGPLLVLEDPPSTRVELRLLD